ncbi:hypothetical protein G6F70_007826 [Rhizopus microsporus]|nr:hypothetical protein G6F71_007778 [Rhizopus microsporus]KAG1195963.1 hypothetical protein G6F70_007826 [Rhizopus microsporus]KAG1208192.1 hypothetical protein G6F69_007433 [Rhizopus microsporus]KAG1229452.1 hypothetical protein G6F67_007145 [Rhizopus microsporus]KAG1261411.1 hypothetical protein G6F68_006707 [Rhizopus microsporus]
MDISTYLLCIVDQLNTEKLTRIQATMELMNAEQKFVKTICDLIQKLPNEAEPCSQLMSRSWLASLTVLTMGTIYVGRILEFLKLDSSDLHDPD